MEHTEKARQKYMKARKVYEDKVNLDNKESLMTVNFTCIGCFLGERSF